MPSRGPACLLSVVSFAGFVALRKTALWQWDGRRRCESGHRGNEAVPGVAKTRAVAVRSPCVLRERALWQREVVARIFSTLGLRSLPRRVFTQRGIRRQASSFPRQERAPGAVRLSPRRLFRGAAEGPRAPSSVCLVFSALDVGGHLSSRRGLELQSGIC